MRLLRITSVSWKMVSLPNPSCPGSHLEFGAKEASFFAGLHVDVILRQYFNNDRIFIRELVSLYPSDSFDQIGGF